MADLETDTNKLDNDSDTKQTSAVSSKVRIAVFDIDGTTIDGQSPAIITLRLFTDGLMGLGTAIKAGIWGIKYKAGLTTNTTGVRQKVFKSFTEIPADEANQIMENIYKKRVSPRIREKALSQIRWHKNRGDIVIFISASFDCIAQLLADETQVYRQTSTKMEIKDGYYTGRVDGLPVEGNQKPLCLIQYANKEFGEGNWVLDYSYADHETDIPILEMSKHPVAVNPKRGLKTVAQKRGWDIVEW